MASAEAATESTSLPKEIAGIAVPISRTLATNGKAASAPGMGAHGDATPAGPGTGSRSMRATGSELQGPTNSVTALPDLTDRLHDLGLHAEYVRFREGYLQWRQGGHRGARGENTVAGLSRTSVIREIDPFHANFHVWRWRRTLSYWIAVSFFQGSLLFAFTSLASLMSFEFASKRETFFLTVPPNFLGGCFFALGTYLMCFETGNLRATSITFFPFSYKTVFARLDAMENLDVTRLPYLSSMSFFIGANIYFIGLISEFFKPFASETVELTLVTMPYLIGGALFFAGGLFECIDVKPLTDQRSPQVRTIALMNLFGGWLFFQSALLTSWGWWSTLSVGVGSVLYTIGASICIVMWRDDQFGFSYLSALNAFSRKSSHLLQALPPSSAAETTPPNGSTSQAVQGGENGNETGSQAVGPRRSPRGPPRSPRGESNGSRTRLTTQDVTAPAAPDDDQQQQQEQNEDAGVGFSVRGTFFLHFYCFVAVLEVFNFSLSFSEMEQARTLEAATHCFNEWLPWVLMHMVLLLHSAVVSVPKVQPYRALVIAIRFVAVITGLNSCVIFFCILQHGTPANGNAAVGIEAAAGHASVTTSWFPRELPGQGVATLVV